MEIGISVVPGRVGREQDRCCCLGENKRERKEDDGGQVLWKGKGESGCRDGVNGRKTKSLRSSHGKKLPPSGVAGSTLSRTFQVAGHHHLQPSRVIVLCVSV